MVLGGLGRQRPATSDNNNGSRIARGGASRPRPCTRAAGGSNHETLHLVNALCSIDDSTAYDNGDGSTRPQAAALQPLHDFSEVEWEAKARAIDAELLRSEREGGNPRLSRRVSPLASLVPSHSSNASDWQASAGSPHSARSTSAPVGDDDNTTIASSHFASEYSYGDSISVGRFGGGALPASGVSPTLQRLGIGGDYGSGSGGLPTGRPGGGVAFNFKGGGLRDDKQLAPLEPVRKGGKSGSGGSAVGGGSDLAARVAKLRAACERLAHDMRGGGVELLLVVDAGALGGGRDVFAAPRDSRLACVVVLTVVGAFCRCRRSFLPAQQHTDALVVWQREPS